MKKFFILIFILFSTILSAKVPLVVLKTNKLIVKSGEDLRVVISVKAKKDSQIVFPKITNIAGYGIKQKRFSEIGSKGLVNNKLTPLIIKSVIYHISPTKSFTIPSYKVKVDKKTYKTKPVKIKVVSLKKDKNSNGDFIFRMKSSKSTVSVGEPFIVTVELIEPLKYGDAIFEYKQPDFKGFKVLDLGDAADIEQGEQVIKSIKYILIPTKPGKFLIPKAKIKISLQVAPAMQTPFDFMGSTMQYKSLSTNPLEIKVLDIPNADIVGDYKIEAKVNKTKVKANKPVEYTLKIEGEGTLDNIKDPEIKIDNVNVYSEDSNVIHKYDNNKVYSIYTKKYVFIADKDFIIPSVKITAYNPKNKKLYTLETKEIPIKIKKLSTISAILNKALGKEKSSNQNIKANNTQNIISSKKSQEIEKIEDILLDKEYYKRKYSKEINSSKAIVIFIIGLIIGAVLMLFILKFVKNRFNGGAKSILYGSYQEALNILYPHINEDKKIEEMVKQLYEVINGNKEIKIDEKALRKMVKKAKKRDA